MIKVRGIRYNCKLQLYITLWNQGINNANNACLDRHTYIMSYSALVGELFSISWFLDYLLVN